MEKNEQEDILVDEQEDTETEEIDWKQKFLEEEGRRKRAETKLEKTKSNSEEKKEEPKQNQEDVNLTTKDVLALAKANIADEDLDLVLKWAKFEKVSVAEALKSNVVKTIIKDAEEKRKSAEVTYTGTARKSSNKVSDADILAKARSGKELSDEEMARLASM